MRLYANSQVYQDKQNTKYPTLAQVGDPKQLESVAQQDHTAGEFRNFERSIPNFIKSDVAIMDIDNDHTNAPDEWITPEDVAADLPNVEFYAVTSRNHNKTKHPGEPNESSERPRYHIYFPISEKTDAGEYKQLKTTLSSMYCYYDKAALDVARFIYGNKQARATYHPGKMQLDEYLKALPPKKDLESIKDIQVKASDLDIIEALKHIDPAKLDYKEWVSVGMALKNAGESCQVWNEWSRPDPRYNESEIQRKWNGFRIDNNGYGKGTLVYLAILSGWKPAPTNQEPKPDRETYLKSNAAELIPGLFKSIEAEQNAPEIRTGLKSLDDAIDYLNPGLYFVGAESAAGKTTLTLQIADTIAKQGIDVLFFSLEMSRYELMAKSLSRITYEQTADKNKARTTRGILNGRRWKDYQDEQKETIRQATLEYNKYAKQIYIVEGMGNIGVFDIRKKAEMHKELTEHTPVIFIDYLQILAPADPRATDKMNIDKAVLELKRLSRDLKTPVICVSSFNRASYTESVGYASFKESGSIEYSSDVLIGLQYAGMARTPGETDKDRTKRILELQRTNKQKAKDGDPIEIECCILKNRNGASGTTVNLMYIPKFNYYADPKDFIKASDTPFTQMQTKKI